MAADSSMMHYQLKNSSVCLHVKKPPPYRNALWTFDGKFVADTSLISPDYRDRVIFTSENMSLCIYRLMDNDTGIFKASYTSVLDQISDEHQIIVQGKFKWCFVLSLCRNILTLCFKEFLLIFVFSPNFSSLHFLNLDINISI